jgi:hypothetical protein
MPSVSLAVANAFQKRNDFRISNVRFLDYVVGKRWSEAEIQNFKQHSPGAVTSDVIRVDRRCARRDPIVGTARETHIAENNCWPDCFGTPKQTQFALRTGNTHEVLLGRHALSHSKGFRYGIRVAAERLQLNGHRHF